MQYWWLKANGDLHAPAGGKEMPGRGLESGRTQSEESTPEQIHRKTLGVRLAHPDRAIIDALGQDRKQSWAFLMGGGSMIVARQISYPDSADPAEYIQPAGVDVILPTYRFIRENLADALPNMRPADIVVDRPDDVWCLRSTEQHLVYALRGGSFRIDLSAAPKTLDAQWINPRTGELTVADVTGGSIVDIAPPDDQDWALWLRRR